MTKSERSKSFTGKNVAVVGMARSGLAAADVLRQYGAEITLYDGKQESELAEAINFATQRSIRFTINADRVDDKTEIVVTSPGVRRIAPILVDAVDRNLRVWGEIEAAYRISPAPIIAITGTNGKTTTTALVGDILRRAGVHTFIGGNIAAGELAMPLIRAAELAKSSDVIVAEISSFQLEWIDRFRPKVAAILNITPDHLDRQTWPEYIAAKWRIFENQTDEDFAVIGRDVPKSDKALTLASKLTNFDELPRPDWIDSIRLPGEHNKRNVMAAIAIARSMGISDNSICEACLEFKGVVHRLEYITEIDGVRWINNSMCTNNDAFANSLEAILTPKIVIAGGVYKSDDTVMMEPIGIAAASPANKAIIWFGRSALQLDRCARENGARRSEVVLTLKDAVKRAYAIAEPGDTVVLNPGCASFDQFNDFEDRGEQFKQLVRELEQRRN